jgi:hypothetical protein
MSQYLSFELVNKANPEIKVDLGYWCTSIARGITYNFNNIFTYTNDGDVALDKETLESYINELHAGIDDFKLSLQKSQKKKEESVELLLRVQTETAASTIKEDVDMYDTSIEEWQEEIDTWESVERKLNFILYLLEDNVDEWKLVYGNS